MLFFAAFSLHPHQWLRHKKIFLFSHFYQAWKRFCLRRRKKSHTEFMVICTHANTWHTMEMHVRIQKRQKFRYDSAIFFSWNSRKIAGDSKVTKRGGQSENHRKATILLSPHYPPTNVIQILLNLIYSIERLHLYTLLDHPA